MRCRLVGSVGGVSRDRFGKIFRQVKHLAKFLFGAAVFGGVLWCGLWLMLKICGAVLLK